MIQKVVSVLLFSFLTTVTLSCTERKDHEMKFTGAQDEVKLITLDPGHFHAALVQKSMYRQIASEVHVYAPQGPEVEDHLGRIEGFNTRTENPTSWKEKVYTGPDFLEKMLTEIPGNVVVLSGNNSKKTEYIKAAVDAGLNVLADKPMCIDQKGFQLLRQAFDSAKKQHLLLYDIMTERFEITNLLQKELINNRDVFGELEKGTPEEPAVVKETVHHLFKLVSGTPLKRPGWYFDTTQQGEGIVDVTTHLVDSAMWVCFPEQIIDYTRDIQMKKARRWPTIITREQFEKVTQLADFPEFLRKKLDDKHMLPCYCNGEMLYTIKGVHTRISDVWNFQAPSGAGDTQYSIIRGTKAHLVVRQGKEQNYRPELYVESAGANADGLGPALKKAVADLQNKYPGVILEQTDTGGTWLVQIPEKRRIGHEAHFAKVTEKYLRCLVEGKLPDWEVPNMIAKYYITTKALELAMP
ncbi:MAG: hypothetical protein JXD22_08725 [Sedimentisphaerales bacterium]|nr:hypothetical protein [Sedimentisphaerales bacterium]